MYYAYVLLSKVNGMLYKGSTENLELRVKAHNAGMVTFTSKYCPWELVYFEQFSTRSEAMAREKFFKSGKGREWLRQKLA